MLDYTCVAINPRSLGYKVRVSHAIFACAASIAYLEPDVDVILRDVPDAKKSSMERFGVRLECLEEKYGKDMTSKFDTLTRKMPIYVKDYTNRHLGEIGLSCKPHQLSACSLHRGVGRCIATSV